MKLEDLLKAQGFSDADILAAAPLLGDQKFRGAIEKYTGEYEQENNRWADWAEKVNKPQLDGLGREKLELTGKVGSLEARLKALDPTFTPGTPPPERKTEAGADFDPAKHGLLTEKNFEDRVAQYAAAQGSAIAMANDLAMEYRRLTGADMLDYQYTDADGRQMRGMSALLQESRNAKRPLPDFIAEKFDFAGKRATAAQKQREEAEAVIRKDERTKVVAEFGNPNTRPGMPSTQPFIPQRPTADGKQPQPWEVPAAERRNNRITKAVENQARSTVN